MPLFLERRSFVFRWIDLLGFFGPWEAVGFPLKRFGAAAKLMFQQKDLKVMDQSLRLHGVGA